LPRTPKSSFTDTDFDFRVSLNFAAILGFLSDLNVAIIAILTGE
jgi:hypothetical protein